MNRVAKWALILAVAFCLVMAGATIGRLNHTCPVTYIYPGGMD